MLLACIAAADRAIEPIVYRLYGLTEEVAAVVERRGQLIWGTMDHCSFDRDDNGRLTCESNGLTLCVYTPEDKIEAHPGLAPHLLCGALSLGARANEYEIGRGVGMRPFGTLATILRPVL